MRLPVAHRWVGQGRAGVRASGCGREGWGPAVPGAGSGLHCRGTAPASHMQCNSNAPRGRPLSRPPCPHRPARQPPRRALPHVHPTLLLGGATLRPEGAATLPWTQAFARRQGRLVTRPVLLADPAVFCSPRGTIQGVERPRLSKEDCQGGVAQEPADPPPSVPSCPSF